MTPCAYHTHNAASVNCNGCGKALCPACDHRIKGFPYCQDCIVAGVEQLRSNHQAIYVPIVKKHTSPFFSVLLSLFCPGLGAAYNGQTSKALIHFVAFIGLFQMAIATGGSPLFVLGFLGMWFFAALDAWRTAQVIRAGITPNAAEDILVGRFAGNTKLWGVVLTVIGGSFVLQTLFDLNQLLSRFILPVLLLGLGVYLLKGFFVRRDDLGSESGADDHTPAREYVNDDRFDASFFDASADPYEEVRSRSWKNRR
ncbi:MAG: hypothetical protein HKN33_03840 [Pyrinomonadaceae bacterium]|nr:hypothetical protein [Pyrinomonadaceae bacterium]